MTEKITKKKTRGAPFVELEPTLNPVGGAEFRDPTTKKTRPSMKEKIERVMDTLRESKRAGDYIGTAHGRIDDPKVKEKIALSKVLTKAREAFRGEKTSVRVRARLGKDNPDASKYRIGGSLKRYTSQDIRPEHGTRHDIYFRKRR